VTARWQELTSEEILRPGGLCGWLSPAEIFHEVLEHRWYMSEAAGRDVGTAVATRSYIEQVLPAVPAPLALAGAASGTAADGTAGGLPADDAGVVRQQPGLSAVGASQLDQHPGHVALHGCL
jgi:hypothetical protein